METLYGLWVQLPEVITVPAESFLYAYDVEEYVQDEDNSAKQTTGNR